MTKLDDDFYRPQGSRMINKQIRNSLIPRVIGGGGDDCARNRLTWLPVKCQIGLMEAKRQSSRLDIRQLVHIAAGAMVAAWLFI